MEFTVRLEPTYADYRHALMLARGRNRLSTILNFANNILLLGLMLFLLLFSLVSGYFSLPIGVMAIAIAFLILFFLVVQSVVAPSRYRKVFEQSQRLTGFQEITVRDDALATKAQFGQAVIPWNRFAKWSADERLLLIFQTDAQFHLLPKRQFTGEQIGEIVSALRTAGVPEKKVSWVRPVILAVETAILIGANGSFAFIIAVGLLSRLLQ